MSQSELRAIVFIFRGKKLRFLVMPRFGTDLQSVLDASGNVLSKSAASAIAIQVVSYSDSYRHSSTYVDFLRKLLRLYSIVVTSFCVQQVKVGCYCGKLAREREMETVPLAERKGMFTTVSQD